MFSKNPVEIARERKLGKEEVADALRLAIAAEIDAINLYLQLARLIDDGKIKAVFEDVAKEEKTHLGEFLEALKSVDVEQVEQLRAGAEEVAGIRAADPPPPTGALSDSEIRAVEELARQRAAASRRLRKALQTYVLGPGADVAPLEEASPGDVISARRTFVPLREISVKFSVSQRQIDLARSRGEPPYSAAVDAAARRLVELEESAIVESILSDGRIQRMPLSSWGAPGEAVRDVSAAVSALLKAYVPEPYILLVSPARYSRLLSVSERAGFTELERVRGLVKEVLPSPQLGDELAIVLSADGSVLDVAVGADTATAYLGPSDGDHVFRIWETLALRIKDPRGVVVLRQ
ncbi:MAG: family 1 encapsulin nanocompartment shell protein [Thermoproteus sp.]|jgi:uncharacterized linocin/CFP29 family protein